MTRYHIISLKLIHEQDLISILKVTRHLSKLIGFSAIAQTKLSTVLSESARYILRQNPASSFELFVDFKSKSGKVSMITEIYTSDGTHSPLSPDGFDEKDLTIEIEHLRKLTSDFKFEQDGDKVNITISYNFPEKLSINEQVINDWIREIASAQTVSPYEQIKQQNSQLVEALNTLQHQKEEIEILTEELQSRNNKLKQKNNELDDFAHIASHDLKSPLHAMQIIIDVLQTSELDKKEFQKKVSQLDNQARYMEHLINDILAYSRATKNDVERKKVNTQKLVKEIIDNLVINNGYEFIIEEDLPVIKTEEVYLRQIFSNLLSNAVKYHNKPNGFVRVGSNDAGEFIEFEVEDNGPGIPFEDQEKIFKLFENLGRSKEESRSTGIGLSIIKKIIQEKGGAIRVDSDGKSGTKFQFKWPK